MSSFDPLTLVGSRDADVVIQANTLSGSSARRLTGVRIPRWARMIFIECIGSGGGGGGGRGNTAGTARGGGGGGASGGYSVKFVPAMMLGGMFYVVAPTGGPGGAGGSLGNGGNGLSSSRSAVQLSPVEALAASTLIASQSTAGTGGGGGGTNSGGGTAGGAPTVFSETLGFAAARGVWVTTAGSAGATGGAQTGAVGSNRSVSKSLTGGAGGAGCTTTEYAGGDVVAPADTQVRNTMGGAAGSGAGESGIIYSLYGQHMGGSGGGSSNSTTGGAGGDGAIGCGGGGGGAGVTVGGAGGRGGDGRVRIWWFR